MGHNLGMEHDCLNSNCAHWSSSYVGPRKFNGEDCYGYMDYKDGTDGWSECSVDDFTKYINRQSSFCLPTLSGGGGNGNNGKCTAKTKNIKIYSTLLWIKTLIN